MKKLNAVLIVSALLFTGIIIGGWFVQENYSSVHEYAKTTVVSEVNYNTDEVYCVDFNGDEWVFTGCEDWVVGDYCSMIMNDMGTKNIYDDEIVSCRYDGWLEGSFGLIENNESVIEMY